MRTLSREFGAGLTQVLQKLCELAIALCGAHSAGIRIEAAAEGTSIFRWRALSGEMTSCLPALISDNSTPYGPTGGCSAPRLFSRPEAPAPYVPVVEPSVSELLLIPFCVEDKPVGTLWVVSSENDRRFDAEDARLLTSLSQFAGAAYKFSGLQEDMQAANAKLAAEIGQYRAAKEERRAGEAGLAQQARVFETALSSIADYVFTCDLEGRITYANRARLTLWRREIADVLGKTFLELDYPQELAGHIQAQIQTVIATGQPLRAEAEYTGASGIAGYYDYILVPVFDQNGTVEAVAGSTRDMTARQRENAEKEALHKALEVERARLTSLFMQAPAFIAVLKGARHVFELVNAAYLQLVGQRDLIGKPAREAFPELEGQGFFEILDEVYGSGKPFVGKDIRIRFQETADAPARERFLDFVYQPLIEADGAVSGIFAHGVDLTERKRAEQALQESELKFRSLFENAREAIGIATKGRIVFVNPAYAQLLGYASPDEMIGLSALETVAPKDQPRLIAMAQKRNAGEDVPFSYEYRGRKKDGTECDLENYVSSYEQNGQIYTVVTTRDITARKQQEIARQFLAEASAVLASSLDYELTLQQVADLAVPHIADWCGVDIREEDGSISQLAVAHVNPEKVKWGHELRRRYPPDPNAERGLPGVLRSGQAEIYSHISDELLVAGARDPEHLEMMRQIGLELADDCSRLWRGNVFWEPLPLSLRTNRDTTIPKPISNWRRGLLPAPRLPLTMPVCIAPRRTN